MAGQRGRHIYIYTHTHTHTYVYTYIHTHTYIHTYIHTHTYVHTYSHTKNYLHRFKIIDSPECPCGHNDQTTDHILLECTLLSKERYSLISAVSRTDHWPTDKHKLITKHYKAFTRFTNQISFDKLNAHNTLMT